MKINNEKSSHHIKVLPKLSCFSIIYHWRWFENHLIEFLLYFIVLIQGLFVELQHELFNEETDKPQFVKKKKEN
jgi:hypothetical protein